MATIKLVLSLLEKLSSLRANPSKRSVLFLGTQGRLTGRQETFNHLKKWSPVRYLSIPLISSQLKYVDWRPLVEMT